MAQVIRISLLELQAAATRIVQSHDVLYMNHLRKAGVRLYGVPRGGIPAAALLATAFAHAGVPAVLVDAPDHADMIVDDLIDSGATCRRYGAAWGRTPFHALVCKVKHNADVAIGAYPSDAWLVFPWEVEEQGNDNSAHDIVTRLLQYIGEDPTREGLRDTPRRVITAWKEWASGYGQDPATVLKCFTDGAADYDQMVVVHNVPVVSYCEHHLAPIHGVAHVGYIPSTKIVGLSKLARLVDVFARRLQVQERMTTQIADALVEHLQPVGAGVLIRAAHMCMSSRGVKIHNSITTTSAMRGVLLDKEAARVEFLQLCRDAEHMP